MKKKILNETTKFCNECSSKECCPEEECVLFRIEKILFKKQKIKKEVKNERYSNYSKRI